MVKRGPRMRPQASEGEAQHGLFCGTGRFGQGHERLHCGWHGQDRSGSEGGEPTGSSADCTEGLCLPLQANWIGSWTAVAMALQCARRSRLAGDLRAVLKAQINKTDRNDARGIAQMMRVGLYRLVHVKTLRSQKLRMLLTHRKLLQSKAIAVDN